MPNVGLDDLIHNQSLDFIQQLNRAAQSAASSPALQDVSLQIVLHLVSCISALRDMLENTQAQKKTGVQMQLVLPVLNGILGTVGKVLLDTLSFEPKLTEQVPFAESHTAMLHHTLRLFPELALKKHKASGKVLLHHAVSKARTFLVDDSVQTILTHAPDSASFPDSILALPLHWATRNPEMTVSALDLMLQRFPGGAERPDEKGLLPLHWSVNCDDSNVEIVRRVLRAYPAAARTPSRAGHLPLHYATMRDAPSVPVLKVLLAAYPDGVTTACNEGYLPLHRLVHRSAVDREALHLLLKHYADGLTQRTEHGQTPLLLALDHPKPDFAACRLLLRANPKACNVCDLGDYFPLHTAVDGAQPDYQLCSELLDAYPEAAGKETKEGLTPLQLMAATNQRPLELQQELSPDTYSAESNAPAEGPLGEFLRFLRALLDKSPESAVTPVKDIVPVLSELQQAQPIAEELLESWSGEWKETTWTCYDKVCDRGMWLVAREIEVAVRRHGLALPRRTQVQPAGKGLRASRPLKILENVLEGPGEGLLASQLNSASATPATGSAPSKPRKFVLDGAPSSPERGGGSLRANVSATTPGSNTRNDDGIVERFAAPPEVEEVGEVHDDDLDYQSEQEQQPRELVQLGVPDNMSEAAVTVISSLSGSGTGTGHGRRHGGGRAPPSQPLPINLRRAAEAQAQSQGSSNVQQPQQMRLPKSQMEALLRGNDGGSVASAGSKRSKISKRDLLRRRARQNRERDGGDGDTYSGEDYSSDDREYRQQQRRRGGDGTDEEDSSPPQRGRKGGDMLTLSEVDETQQSPTSARSKQTLMSSTQPLPESSPVKVPLQPKKQYLSRTNPQPQVQVTQNPPTGVSPRAQASEAAGESLNLEVKVKRPPNAQGLLSTGGATTVAPAGANRTSPRASAGGNTTVDVLRSVGVTPGSVTAANKNRVVPVDSLSDIV